jgi:hypothetical protein
MSRWIVILASLAMVLHCSHPGGREIDGKVKGKASLRLADGSTISQPNSDEYRPQIVTLDDGYLVLAFGSNRTCGGCTTGYHNIFLAKSLTPYIGTELPFFAPPVVFRDEDDYPINDPNRINFAVVASGYDAVDVYFNNHADNSNSIYQATFDFSVNYGYPGLIDNWTCPQCEVIGTNAAGNRLVVLDQQQQGMAFIIDPGGGVTDIPYGFWLANANSAMQVRQEVSGFDDAYIATMDGWSLATTGASPLGPILPFDLSVLGSGLQLTSIGAFYSNNPLGDLVLFSANDGQSDDMYIVTSHTAGELWGLTTVFSE